MNAFNLDSSNREKWSELLRQAVSQPGLMLKASSAFHGYSLGNQLAALMQCNIRGIEPGPIDTYKGWQEKGRQVRKGEKAIWLCMPLTRKKKNEDTGDDEEFITCFSWKPNWFVLTESRHARGHCQTLEGQASHSPLAPGGLSEYTSRKRCQLMRNTRTGVTRCIPGRAVVIRVRAGRSLRLSVGLRVQGARRLFAGS